MWNIFPKKYTIGKLDPKNENDGSFPHSGGLQQGGFRELLRGDYGGGAGGFWSNISCNLQCVSALD